MFWLLISSLVLSWAGVLCLVSVLPDVLRFVFWAEGGRLGKRAREGRPALSVGLLPGFRACPGPGVSAASACSVSCGRGCGSRR